MTLSAVEIMSTTKTTLLLSGLKDYCTLQCSKNLNTDAKRITRDNSSQKHEDEIQAAGASGWLELVQFTHHSPYLLITIFPHLL